MIECLYEYQKDGFDATEKNNKGIVILPTGMGKSYLQAAVIANDIIKNSGKFGVYVINAPRILLSYQLLKEVYGFLVNSNINARFMSVHSGGKSDIKGLEEVRRRANGKHNIQIEYGDFGSGTSPIFIRDFYNKVKNEDVPLVIFSTYNSADKINTALGDCALDIVCNDEAQYLVQESFHPLIKKTNSKRMYFFTATTQHTPSKKGRGMNNQDIYGDVIFKITPREAIELGKMCRPRMQHLKHINSIDYQSEDFEKSLGKIIKECFEYHKEAIGAKLSPKMLVSVKGSGDMLRFINSDEYSILRNQDVMIYAISSNDMIGNFINGENVTRNEFLKRLKSDGENPTKEMIILHYEILTEGIDVSGISGILPLRILKKSKFIQTFGRAARPDKQDRINVDSKLVKPDELGKLNKPYAWIIIPDIILSDKDNKTHIATMINELRSYGFNPSEDIISSDLVKGAPKPEDIGGISVPDKKMSNDGDIIKDIITELECERIANLDKIDLLYESFDIN